MRNAPGVFLLEKIFHIRSSKKRLLLNRILVFFLTFCAYIALHMSRKPFSALKHTFKGEPNLVSTGVVVNETKIENSHKADNISRLIYSRLESSSDNSTIHDNDLSDETISTEYDISNGWAPFNGNNSVLYFSILDTVWASSYAISMYATGHIAEKTSLRFSLLFSLILSGFSCMLLGLPKYTNIHNLGYYIFVQLFAGFVHSFGWPCVMALMTHWFGKTKLGTVTGIWSAHNFSGNILGQVVAGYFVQIDWGLSFIVPGAITALYAPIMILFLNEDPKSVGIENEDKSVPLLDENGSPSMIKPEKYDSGDEEGRMLISTNKDYDMVKTSKEDLVEDKPINFFKALILPGVLEYSFALFFIKLVVYSFLFWLPYYINEIGIENYNVNTKTSAYIASAFDAGSILGAFMLGSSSDIVKAPGIICVVCQIIGAISLVLYNYFGSFSIVASIVFLLLCGIFVNGPATLIATSVSASLSTIPELKNAKAHATVAAIINATGSVGAALGPFLIKAISTLGWSKVMIFLMACLVSSAILLSRQFVREIKYYSNNRKRRNMVN